MPEKQQNNNNWDRDAKQPEKNGHFLFLRTLSLWHRETPAASLNSRADQDRARESSRSFQRLRLPEPGRHSAIYTSKSIPLFYPYPRERTTAVATPSSPGMRRWPVSTAHRSQPFRAQAISGRAVNGRR